MLSGTRAAAEKKTRSVDIEIGGRGADISSKVMQGNSEVKYWPWWIVFWTPTFLNEHAKYSSVPKDLEVSAVCVFAGVHLM